MSPKHLDRYVREFAGRYNWRDYDTIEQMQIMARHMTRAKLPYEKLTAGGPAYPKLEKAVHEPAGLMTRWQKDLVMPEMVLARIPNRGCCCPFGCPKAN